MLTKCCNILLIDKKEKHSFLFDGLRKNKFSLHQLKTIDGLTNNDLGDIDLFFVVLYNDRDVFELLKLKKINTPVIIGAENLTILKKIRKIDCFSVLDMTSKFNLMGRLHNCLVQVLG